MNLLKQYWREVAIAILIIICILSVRACKNQKELTTVANSKSDSTYHEAVAVKLKNGQLTFRVNTLEATTEQLKRENILENKKLKDQIGSLSNLVTFYQGKMNAHADFAAIAHDTIVNVIHDKDTTRIKEKTFLAHPSKWLTIHSIYNPVTDSIFHRYRYWVDFDLKSYWRGKNLFHRGDLVSDITFSDPAVSVGEFQGIIVKEPPKKWHETTLAKVLFGVGVGIAITR